jgi:uncharacterized RDD family membrane protein YckC
MIMFYDGVIILGLLVVASAIALPLGDADKMALQNVWFTLWLLSVCALYLTKSWRAGMTLGMRAWRVRLVSEDGGAVSWPRCLLRFTIGLVSLGALGAGVLWALVDSENRTWHDLAARTLLVRQDRNLR